MKKKITTIAIMENLNQLTDFIEEILTKCKLDLQTRVDILVACEAVFSNIVNYAYTKKKGEVSVMCEFIEMYNEFRVTFVDQGRQFDPNSIEEINVKVPLTDRKPGRLGILLVKKRIDKIEYSFENERNKLVLTKKTNFSDHFEIKIEKDSDQIILHVIGDINAQKTQKFEEEINKVLIDNCDKLVVDFAQTGAINSAGLKVLLKIHKRISQLGGGMAVTNASDVILNSLKMTGFLNVIEVK